jgi:hypothetical protein
MWGVSFAAIIAATSAAATASPFDIPPDLSRLIVLGFNLISPTADASLEMMSFSEMSTIENRCIAGYL